MNHKKKRNKKGFNSWKKVKTPFGLWFWVHRKYGTVIDSGFYLE